MTREEATKQALSLGLSGQALQQKIEELMGNTASDFGGGSWKYGNEGEAEKTIAKYGGQTSEDVAAQRLTKEQQGIQAKGNQGDNAIVNPNALDTADVTKVHNVEKAAVQTPDNMEPTTFTPDRDAALEATGVKPGKTATINKNDTPEDKNSKKRYNQSMMSIWDAYHNGLFGVDENGNPTEDAKSRAMYYTIDAIATLAKNLGRGIGNVGAQFTGGTIDKSQDKSLWDQRRDKLFNEELQGEAESISNYANTMKKYNLNKASSINDLLNAIKSDIDKLDDNNPAKMGYYALAAQIAQNQIDGTTALAATGASAAAPFLEKIFGGINKVFGGGKE